MTIEFTNAKPSKNQSPLSIALLVVSCLFFFIPASLVVLGYYASLPTGTLVSPLPQGVLTTVQPLVTQASVIAAPETAISSSSATTASNSTQKTATLTKGLTEATISDPEILENSQVYLINKDGDKNLYTVKNKSVGQFVLATTTASETDLLIDYQIINP